MFDVLEPGDPRQVGRFRIVARLGAGGMGQVFLARSPGGRPVAVKVVRPELEQDPDFRRRFAREVAAARRVNGAFTAGVVDADPDGSPAWLATVYVPGVSLGEAIATHGPWPTPPILALGAGLAEALDAIHAAGVVHRDLKPSNVLLASDGPRVIDFGISLASEATMLTRTGMTIGTPGFMSPEQLTGRAVGPASDVFALGAVLAYTATGRGPFGTGTPHALHYRAVHEEPDIGALDVGLRDVVAACLAKQPEERPGVAALLDRLTAAVGAIAEGDADGGTLVLAEPGWMPDPVVRLVQDNATTAVPRTPPPATPQAVPTLPAATLLDRSVPTVPAGTRTSLSVSPAVPAPPEPPDLRPPDQAPTGTGQQPDAGTSNPVGQVHQAEPVPQPATGPSPAPPPVSRRRALLALTGTVVAAATAVTGWKVLDNGSGTPNEAGADTSGPPSTTPGGLRWAFRTDDMVYSSPTVTDGVVYFGSNDNNLYAVDAATGRKRWIFPTGYRVYSSPVVTDGVVYFDSNDHNLYAVDAATGKQRWVFHTGGVVASGLVMAGGAIYLGDADHDLYALDAATGAQRWSFATGDQLVAAPVVSAGVVYAASDDRHVYAVDAATGKQRWAFRTDGKVVSTPVVTDGVVYFGSNDNNLYAVDAATGKRRWVFPTDDSILESPIAANGLVYACSFDQHLYAVDAATGERRWAFGTGSYPEVSPAIADGTVLVGSDDHHLYAVDSRSGERRWAFDVGSSLETPPMVNGGVVYVGSDDHLYAVDASTGKQRWAFPTDDKVASMPVVANGVVYFGSSDSHLYAVHA